MSNTSRTDLNKIGTSNLSANNANIRQLYRPHIYFAAFSFHQFSGPDVLGAFLIEFYRII